jgi:hypothetical protein
VNAVPRYLLETQITSQAERDRVLRLAAQRFPEVALEHCFAVRDGSDERDLWICRATSDAHIWRFAHAAAVQLYGVRQIQAGVVIGRRLRARAR